MSDRFDEVVRDYFTSVLRNGRIPALQEGKLVKLRTDLLQILYKSCFKSTKEVLNY